MIKELLLVGTTVFALATSSVGVAKGVSVHEEVKPQRGNHVSVAMIHAAEKRAQEKAELLQQMELEKNYDKINAAIEKLRGHIGKTWYVFSGSTPSGWDCSGMTLWFYNQLGIELEHRATKQSQSGTKTISPKLGDIVVFKYKNSKSAYHVGIWVSEDLMIHAGGKKGDRTEYASISGFAGNYSKIEYRNFIETL